MNNEGTGKNSGQGKIPAPALIALAAVLGLCLVLLALCPGKKDEVKTRADTAEPSPAYKAKSPPPAEYKQKARPEIRLSINDSPESQSLAGGVECLFQVRILNQRAHLARLRTRERETLEVLLDRRVKEGRLTAAEAKKRLAETAASKPEVILAGTKKAPWPAMVHLYALPAAAGEDTQAAEIFPESLDPEGDKGNQLKLDEENEGVLRFAGSPEGLGVTAGDYLIYASLKAPDTADLPGNHFTGEVRSPAVAVSVTEAGAETAEARDMQIYAQARIASERGRREEALRLLDEGIGIYPDSPLSLTLKADILEGEEQYREAYDCLKQALDVVLKKNAGTEEFIEPPSHLVERLNQLRKKIKD